MDGRKYYLLHPSQKKYKEYKSILKQIFDMFCGIKYRSIYKQIIL